MSDERALLVLRDDAGVREWPLGETTELVVGRDPDADVHLPDRQVSRRHAIIRREADRYVIVDLDSKNGTWVNGQPVGAQRALRDGDELSIAARYKLFFVDANATQPLVFERRGMRLDAETMGVWINGQLLDPPLSGLQFALLRALADAGGALVTRDDIIERIWPDDEGGVSEDAIDALVRRLRMRLMEADPEHQYVVTVRGYGFRIEAP